MPAKVEKLIANLRLAPHAEGGWYRETYRSNWLLESEHLPPGYAGPRPLSTSIYYLLAGDQVSRLHRLRGDEIWHHQAGVGLDLHLFRPEAVAGQRYTKIALGGDLAGGQQPQAVVPGGCCFGATLSATLSAKHGDRYALVACTMAPGFDGADFQLEDAAALRGAFPEHAALLDRLSGSAGCD